MIFFVISVMTHNPQYIVFLCRVSFYLHKAIFALPYVLCIFNVQQVGHYLIQTVYRCTIHVKYIHGHTWMYINITPNDSDKGQLAGYRCSSEDCSPWKNHFTLQKKKKVVASNTEDN